MRIFRLELKRVLKSRLTWILLALLFCVVIAVLVFSADYQSGADDILRCTRHGRSRLGVH